MNNDKTTAQQTTRRTPLVGCLTALGMAFTLALPQAAQAQVVTPPPVPPGLEVPAGNELYLLGHATGTQNYQCQPVDSLGRVAWTLFTPEATLFGEQGEQLTTHFFSPNPFEPTPGQFAIGLVRATWQDSRDTSTFWGRAIASVTVRPNAITEVLLQRAGVTPGPTGGSTLSVATFVQRLNTRGGLAPATGCNIPTDVGNRAFVPYLADYLFYKAATSN
jgi:hypothetical protein